MAITLGSPPWLQQSNLTDLAGHIIIKSRREGSPTKDGQPADLWPAIGAYISRGTALTKPYARRNESLQWFMAHQHQSTRKLAKSTQGVGNRLALSREPTASAQAQDRIGRHCDYLFKNPPERQKEKACQLSDMSQEVVLRTGKVEVARDKSGWREVRRT